MENTLIQPHVYQVPVVKVVRDILQTENRALFVMASGLGKSTVSALIVQEWLENGKRGLFLCHETYILKHVEEEYRKVIIKDLIYKTFYGTEAEGTKDWTADNGDMLFASFQALNNWHEKWYQAFDRDHFDFMVVDESHHGQAPTYKEVIDYFKCKKIGMTATPDRADLKDIREIFGQEVYTITLEEGIANGWLAEVEYHILSDGINNRKLRQICKDVLEKGKRVSVKQLNETIFIHERDKTEGTIIAEYSKIKEYAGTKKTLLFCERTAHADNLITHFERSGVMHSKKSWQENEAVFQAFTHGELQYIASVNKFNEGKHVPGVEVIAFLRATDSLTIFWQQLGRALAKTSGKIKVIILDFVANIDRLIMVRDLMNRVKELAESIGRVKLPLDTNPFHVTGEGFEFVFSDDLVDIMKVIEALREGLYSTCNEASVVAKQGKFTSGKDYEKRCKGFDIRLPQDASRHYPDFPGWHIFLGLESGDIGWKSFSEFTTMLGMSGNGYSRSSLKRFLNRYRGKHSKHFQIFFNKSARRKVEHYSPVLVRLVILLLIKKEKFISLGWKTPYDLDREGLADDKTIMNAANLHRDELQQHFVLLWEKGRFLQYYSPELIKLIEDNMKNRALPEGWIVINKLSRAGHGDQNTIARYVNKFVQKHKYAIRIVIGGQARRTYVSPALARLIRHYFSKKQLAPEGWLNAMQLLAKGIAQRVSILKYVKKFNKTNPEWFNQYWDFNRFIEYYHPDLVKKIETHFSKAYSLPPEGWLTISTIGKEIFGATNAERGKIIKQIAEMYKQTNPTWFASYRSGNNLRNYHHPELVQKIKENFAKKKNKK